MTDQTSRGRMVLLLIAGIPLTMFLAATWLWYYVANGELDLVGSVGTHNNGELLQPPRQIDEAVLLDGAGNRLAYADLEPHWSMLIPAGGERCDQACEQSLYLTRQIHIALGKDSRSLQRIYAGDSPARNTPLQVTSFRDDRPAPPDVATLLESDHRGTLALVVSGEGFEQLFPEYLQNPTTWYLVDPRGWIMMSYNADVSYKEVISDLKFLLKN